MHAVLTACSCYLLNSLWQAPLCFAAAWFIDRQLTHGRRSVSALLLYRVWTFTLFAAMLLPAFSAESFRWFLSRWTMPSPAAAAGIQLRLMGGAARHDGVTLPHGVVVVLMVAWSASMLYFALRLLLGSVQVSRLRRASQRLGSEHPVSKRFAELMPKAIACRVELALSPKVVTPVTVGVWRQGVLLPSQLCQRLDPDDLDALLAHESAHLVRHDVARNLLHRVLALPVMWHPATSAILRRIAGAREMICDQSAAQRLPSPQRYARSLVRLASELMTLRSLPPSHAIGFASANTLERRLMQLTTSKQVPGKALQATRIAAIVLAGTLICASAVAMHLQANPQPAPVVPADALSGSIISRVNPVYPKDARAKHIQGTVVVKARIGKDGHIADAEAIKGPPELRQSAVDSVRTWVFKPYVIKGQPTAVDTTIQVNYQVF